MEKEKITEEITDDVAAREGFVAWIKGHKKQLLLAGISVTAILVEILGSKNEDSIYSSKWFEKASLEELEAERRCVQQDYNNPNLDLDYRNDCWKLLNTFDNAIGKIKWDGKEYGYPIHGGNGWYLPSDD